MYPRGIGRGIVHFWVQDWAEDYWTGEATGLPSIPVARDWAAYRERATPIWS